MNNDYYIHNKGYPKYFLTFHPKITMGRKPNNLFVTGIANILSLMGQCC